jgi:hypothetical protein
MKRTFYLELARRGLRMPIGVDLVLHEERDPESVRNDGLALGCVIEKTARRWNTALAVPLMDLRREKIDLLARIGMKATDAEKFQFTSTLDEATLAALCGGEKTTLCLGSQARDGALEYICAVPNLVPVGMAIGPFSLTTRLLADPITAVAMAGSGVTAEDSEDVRLLWQCLQVAEAAVLRSVKNQIAHGAKAVMICEPAACTAFISPRQLKAGSQVFEHLVMEPNRRLSALLEDAGCDLVFHDCGELTDAMVEGFANRLHPVILSLGSSRTLWQDARLVPNDVVLYGNLPSKLFYSDDSMPVQEVVRRTEELVSQMALCGHTHIVGSECDVLFVSEAGEAIARKVDAMVAQGIPR